MKKPEENRGKNMVRIKNANRALVSHFYAKNPTATQDQCSRELGMSLPTIRKHRKALGLGR